MATGPLPSVLLSIHLEYLWALSLENGFIKSIDSVCGHSLLKKVYSKLRCIQWCTFWREGNREKGPLELACSEVAFGCVQKPYRTARTPPPVLPPLKNPDGRSWVTFTLPKDTPNLCLREQTCLQYSNQVSQVWDTDEKRLLRPAAKPHSFRCHDVYGIKWWCSFQELKRDF